jgi:hypothetical protein
MSIHITHAKNRIANEKTALARRKKDLQMDQAKDISFMTNKVRQLQIAMVDSFVRELTAIDELLIKHEKAQEKMR